MRIIRDPAFIAPDDRGAAAAIGNFDGVHLGHKAVIDLTRSIANGAPLGVLTFEPHPRNYFAPDATPFRLMSAAAKANRLEKMGVERLFEVPFNAALAALSPREFAQSVIVDTLGLTHVVVGEDFCFGKDRAGNAQTLKAFGLDMGFGVTIAPMLATSAGEVSSTAIRKALADGTPGIAAEMLGHWHRIDGPVIQGDQRGRDLGYPTANMSIDGLHPPKFGVYAVKVDVMDGPHRGSYNGAASIGVRPMFGVNMPNCESYLFDFSGDLYGAQLSVALVDYLRGEEKFDSLDGLINKWAPTVTAPARSLPMSDPINRSDVRPNFWAEIPLSKMTQTEWEALCDGCGKCCLNKLEDEDTGEVALTRVACKLLDDSDCRCTAYTTRHTYVPECIVLSPKTIEESMYWLPQTCAYRLVYEGKNLFHWHPLISGTGQSVHDAGVSVQDITVSEANTPDDTWEDHIIEEPL